MGGVVAEKNAEESSQRFERLSENPGVNAPQLENRGAQGKWPHFGRAIESDAPERLREP
jgi:hypothetical protein